VTSNLAPKAERADHRQGGSRARNRCQKGRNSFIFKILASKSLGLKILQAIFANLAPVAAFREVGGVPHNPSVSQMKLAYARVIEAMNEYFFSRISQD
jgi:hypothetical protein